MNIFPPGEKNEHQGPGGKNDCVRGKQNRKKKKKKEKERIRGEQKFATLNVSPLTESLAIMHPMNVSPLPGHGDPLHVIVMDVELQLALLAVQQQPQLLPVVVHIQRLCQQAVTLHNLEFMFRLQFFQRHIIGTVLQVNRRTGN